MMGIPHEIKCFLGRLRSRNGIYVQTCWQDKPPGKFGQISKKYDHYGVFTIYYKTRIVHTFDIGIVGSKIGLEEAVVIPWKWNLPDNLKKELIECLN
ncbi:hypothetical protein KAR91_61725 [Candidatus Pacearchaeota archaeon]|nr:hypothetical protein [Candidatus Pacearchaeota archaeon]